MTTGMYLGEIVRNVLVYLVDNDKLFSGSSSDGLNTPYSFDTSYMYVIEADENTEEFEDTRLILEDMLKIGPTTVADREIVKKVCEIVGRRSAMLVGAVIASVVTYMVQHGIGLEETSEGCAICKLRCE
jgi:hexokinase